MSDLNDDFKKLSEEEEKEFIGPITNVTVAGAIWFTLKAGANAIIGSIAVKVFSPVLNYFFKGESKSDKTIPPKDESKEA